MTAVPDTAPDTSDASIPRSSSQRWRWSANVLLIGTSQSGKSTLINRFRTLAVGPNPLPDPAQVGKGTTSCTRDPFVYEYDIPMTDFILLDGQNTTSVEVPDNERDLFDVGFWKRKDLVMQRRNIQADWARIRLIDTPGLDDSDPTRNATNIQKVLRLLNDLSNSEELASRHISAVMFVIKGTVAFHASLQEWYHYYQRCMPNLFGSVAVVNTNIRVRDWKAEYSRKAVNLVSMRSTELNSRDKNIKERRGAWAQLFKNDPAHFFIDSRPNGAFENYMSANTVYDILLYLRSQGRLPIENVRLAKFNNMSSIDAKLASHLRKVCELWEQEREILVLSLSTARQSLARHEKNMVIWKTEIEELEKKIKELDTDIQYDLNTYQPTSFDISMGFKIWKFFTFSGYEGTYSITENVFPYEVSAPDTDSTVWRSRSKANPGTKTWKGEWASQWMKMPEFSIRSYTTNKIVHADKISTARRDILDKEDNMIDTTEIIAKDKELVLKSGSSVEDSPRLLQLTEWIAHGEKQIRHIGEDDVSLQEGFSSSAIRRYAKSIDKIGYSDILDFIATAEPDLRPAVEVAVTQLTEKGI